MQAKQISNRLIREDKQRGAREGAWVTRYNGLFIRAKSMNPPPRLSELAAATESSGAERAYFAGPAAYTHLTRLRRKEGAVNLRSAALLVFEAAEREK